MAGDQLVSGTTPAHDHGLKETVGPQTVSELGDTVHALTRVPQAGLDGRDRQGLRRAIGAAGRERAAEVMTSERYSDIGKIAGPASWPATFRI